MSAVVLDGKAIAREIRRIAKTRVATLKRQAAIAQQAEIKGHDTAAVNGPMVKEVLTGHLSVIVNQTAPPDVTVNT